MILSLHRTSMLARAPSLALLALLGHASCLGLGHRPHLRVPILMYHRIATPPAASQGLAHDLSLSREVFRAHLRELSGEGFESVTFLDLRSYLTGEKTPPLQPVILTFDDGDQSHWGAFEELREQGMKAVFFVVTRTLGTPGHLTLDEALKMQEAGMEIGSHSSSHADLRSLDAPAREREIAGSKRELEGLLGRPVISFAYPGGSYDPACVPLVEAAGYWFARTTAPGVSFVDRKSFELETVPIFSGTRVPRLEAKLKALLAQDPDPATATVPRHRSRRFARASLGTARFGKEPATPGAPHAP